MEEDPSPAIEATHLLPCSGLTEDQLTALEWAWGMKYWTLHADTSKNILFLRSDFHLAFDNDFWFLVPEDLGIIFDEYMLDENHATRSPITKIYKNKKKFKYKMVPFPNMSNVIIPRRQLNTDVFTQRHQEHITYYHPYQNLPTIESHVHPHFVIFNAGQKLVGVTPRLSRTLLQSFPLIQTLYDLWLEPPPPGFATGTQTTKRGGNKLKLICLESRCRRNLITT